MRSATSLDLTGILEVNRQSTPGVATLSSSDVEDILSTAPYVRVADSVMRRRLHLAEWLWTLQCVAKSSTLLQGGLNAEMRLRRDDGANVAVTLEMSLRALAQLRW